MTARALWRASVVAGVLAFVASYLFGRIPNLQPCGASDGLGAIIAFEFVRTPADVATLFGAEPCRSALIAAQRSGLLLDGLWFIPAYTAFLSLAALATGTAWRRWLVAALIVAGVSDEVEGLLLWAIVGDLPGTPGQIAALGIAVHLKFALLALGTFGIGWALSPRPRSWRRLPGALVGGCGIFALLELLNNHVASMMSGFSLGWILLLLIALSGAFWPAVLAAFAGPPQDPAAPAP